MLAVECVLLLFHRQLKLLNNIHKHDCVPIYALRTSRARFEGQLRRPVAGRALLFYKHLKDFRYRRSTFWRMKRDCTSRSPVTKDNSQARAAAEMAAFPGDTTLNVRISRDIKVC